MTRIVRVLAAAAFALSMTSAQGADAQQLETNKKNVVAFYDLALNKKDFDAASKYMGPRYIQHNPVAADECHVMLIERKSTLHTGDVAMDKTRTVEEQLRPV